MANNRIQVKRTSTAGRTPNTTNSGNSQYIAAGEFALNMADGILYSSNGSALIEIGANNTDQFISNSITISQNKPLRFQTVNTSAFASFRQQNDDNFVLYTTNTAYNERPVFSIYANSTTSNLQIHTGLQPLSGIIANGSIGSAGQTLTSNGTGLYWAAGAGTGTVTQVDSGNGLSGGPITTSGTLEVKANTGITANTSGLFVNSSYISTIDANNASYLGGVAAADYQTEAGLSANVATLAANAATYLNGKTENNLNVNSALTANDSSYLNSKTESNLNVNNALTANNSSYLGGTAAASYVQNTDSRTLSGNLTFTANVSLNGLIANGTIGTAGQVLHSDGAKVYWSTDDNSGGTVTSVSSGNGLTGGPITTTGTLSVQAGADGGLVSNSTGIFITQGTGTVVNATGVHVNSSYIATLDANNAAFLGGVAAADYQTEAGLSANVLTLTANNTSFVGTVSAANVVSNAQLSGNLTNYAALAGATFTGAVVVSNNLTVTGNLTLSGNTVIVGANNLVVQDAIVSLHTPANLSALTSNDGKNIGLAFHYYDTEDKHALLYRDNSTGRLQYHNDGSDPLTNNNPTGNNLGVIQANSFWSGNDSVYATTNSTVYTGTANNTTYLNGQLASYYTNATNITTGTLPYAQIPANIVNTTSAFTISGVHTYNANIVVGTTAGISANGGFGTAGHVLHSNGSAVYWAGVSSGSGTVTSIGIGSGLSSTQSPLTTSGTLSVVAGNTQLISNSTGVWANQSNFNHDALLNYDANKHVDHTAVSIASGNGITGGGTIAATRTLSVVAGDGVVVNATGVHVSGDINQAARIRLSATGDAGLLSTTHAFQIGPDAANNLLIDANEILCRNNGLAANLFLNATGGNVYVTNSTGSFVVGSRFLANGSHANATHLNGIDSSSYARTDVADAFDGIVTFNANAVLTKSLSANGGFGTAGQYLKSGAAANTYWGNITSADVTTALGYTPGTGTITGVTASTGLSGGGTSGPVTLSIDSTVLTTSATAQSKSGLMTVGGLAAGSATATSTEIRAQGDIIAFSSDSRLKTDVKQISDALDKVKKITGITYNHNELAVSFGFSDKHRLVGVLAQEIEAVLPEAVTLAPFDAILDEDENFISRSGENYKTVKYDKLVSLLIEAIKELSYEVDELKTEIKGLKK